MSAFAAYARMVCSQQRAAIDALKAENPGKKNVHLTFLFKYRRENLDEWATFRALWTQNHPMESESRDEIQRLQSLCPPGKRVSQMWNEWNELNEGPAFARWAEFKCALEEGYFNELEDPFHHNECQSESDTESDPEWL